jgi:UDP-N-acetylmuramoylalanine-D-glutamate ligase
MEETKPVAAAEMPKPKKAGGFKKFMRWFTFILILALGLFVYWKYYYTYSDGYRSGLLQKFSHRGNIMKTYEGELVLSSVASTNNVALASEKFFFSVANDSIAKVLQNFEGKRVRLHYTQKNGSLPWRGDSEYIVDGVQSENNP